MQFILPQCLPSLQGDKAGGVRFKTAANAQAALDKAEDGRMMVAGYSAAVRVLEGEEEAAYMKKAAEQRAAKHKQAAAGARALQDCASGGNVRCHLHCQS